MSGQPPTSTTSPPPPNTPRAKWGALPSGTWVKTRDLVGRRFHLARVSHAEVNGKPSHVVALTFALDADDPALKDSGADVQTDRMENGAKVHALVPPTGNFQFSVAESGIGTMSAQFARDGVPPTGNDHTFTVAKEPSTSNKDGYTLVLVEL